MEEIECKALEMNSVALPSNSRKGAYCAAPNCKTLPRSGTYCYIHGIGRKCTVDNCGKRDQGGGCVHSMEAARLFLKAVKRKHKVVKVDCAINMEVTSL